MSCSNLGAVIGMAEALIILQRDTSWKCGRLERLALTYLRRQLKLHGRTKVPLKEMILHFKLEGRRKSEFIDAVKRLEQRNIINIIRVKDV